MRGGVTLVRSLMEIGASVELLGAINRAKFHLYLMTNFGTSGGSKMMISL
jgi:hypothetical protein